MHRVGEFLKVSKEQFQKDFHASRPNVPNEDAEDAYKAVTMPFRATKGSAGYEMITPCAISLAPGESVKITTGIRVKIQEGWVFFIFPKSGLGFKYRLQLDNTVGVVDADYFQAENEGYILIQLTNDSKEDKTIDLPAGKSFAQGIFVPFGITQDDEAEGQRVGGFGSTGV